MTDKDRDIINEYDNRIAGAQTYDDMKNTAMALLAHVSFLLGRESIRSEGRKGSDE